MDRIYDLCCEYKDTPMQINVKNPRFCWKIEASGCGVMQKSWEIQVEEERTGEIVWKYGEDNSRTVHIVYQGKELRENTRYKWKITSRLEDGRVLETGQLAFFETGLFQEEIWDGCWIGKGDREDLGNCPLFRKSIYLAEIPARAKIFISARGLYEMSVNGVDRDEYVLTPGWTSYENHLQYLSYDITSNLKEGENVIGVRLGDGWYDGEISFNHQTHFYGDKISFAAVLIMEYEDHKEVIKTDSSWKMADSGIEKSSIYDGEIYDLTKEDINWNCPGYDDSRWRLSDPMPDCKAKMIGMMNEGTRRVEVIEPVGVIHTPEGDTLIDMGQNMTGWVRIRINGSEGDRIRIKHGEVLDKDGNFYSGNLRLAMQEDSYTLRDGENCLEPHFTFHGFRYIKVLEFPKEVEAKYFEGIVLHTDMKPSIEFTCSDPLVNQLCHNLKWGQKGNFLDVPTDCPQRDERLGWTGDAQIFCRTACYNFQADSFFTKWLEDVKADQYENGAVPFVVPDVLPKDWSFMIEAGLGAGHTSAVWGDAVTICPWTLYEYYGDVNILEHTYENMKRYLSYIYDGAVHGSGNPYVWDWGPQLGDWLGLDSEEGSYRGATNENYVATIYYAYSAEIVAKCAEILGKAEDAAYYRDLYEKIKQNFKDNYIDGGKIKIATQTAQILPAYFGLLDAQEEKNAIDALVDMLKENQMHLKTGFAGTPYLCHVLSRYGYGDLAYTLLLQKDFPSWLYQVTQGATTIWEHWDGRKPDGSFWSDNMNSFNHYAYGSIGDWIYRCVAGINTDENKPGFEHIILKPQTNEAFSYAECIYESIRGKIVTRWERSGNGVSVSVTIPANTTASVYLEDGSVRELGSGSYEYQYQLNRG
ncbi:alpha-L-rhamnosidase [Clostridium sp. chh4-2]|uniref:alpha-L-rhamnosidase n=1 Tax=Clostridium sp. chh4-2 TaxID=2067550 RepID=UPI000CCE3D6F|nr:alpha-L-rhamnosidase [Clostridium sp. chh4-2]PNV61680.1 alpha-L-rhamnosidase [Clostridium sp. chh4-2]